MAGAREAGRELEHALGFLPLSCDRRLQPRLSRVCPLLRPLLARRGSIELLLEPPSVLVRGTCRLCQLRPCRLETRSRGNLDLEAALETRAFRPCRLELHAHSLGLLLRRAYRLGRLRRRGRRVFRHESGTLVGGMPLLIQPLDPLVQLPLLLPPLRFNLRLARLGLRLPLCCPRGRMLRVAQAALETRAFRPCLGPFHLVLDQTLLLRRCALDTRSLVLLAHLRARGHGSRRRARESQALLCLEGVSGAAVGLALRAEGCLQVVPRYLSRLSCLLRCLHRYLGRPKLCEGLVSIRQGSRDLCLGLLHHRPPLGRPLLLCRRAPLTGLVLQTLPFSHLDLELLVLICEADELRVTSLRRRLRRSHRRLLAALGRLPRRLRRRLASLRCLHCLA